MDVMQLLGCVCKICTVCMRSNDAAGVSPAFPCNPAHPGASPRLRQILHYQPMEKYEPHWDYFVDPVNTGNGGQRLATMLMYLSDVEEGGETVFPNSPEKPVPRPRRSGWPACCTTLTQPYPSSIS